MSAEGTNEIFSFSLHDKNLNFLFIILHVVIVTLRAKAYDVKILNDVITSLLCVNVHCVNNSIDYKINLCIN